MGNYADIKEVTVDEAKSQILALWTGLGLPFDTYWDDGSIPSMVLEAAANIWNTQSKTAVAMKGLTVGEEAEGDALTLWSWSTYRHARFPATTAIWKVRLTCSATAGPYTLTAGSVVVAAGATTFRLISSSLVGATLPYTLAPGQYVDLAFECETPGAEPSTLPVGSINRLMTTFVGVSAASSQLLRSGSNIETDAELKVRNSTKWATRNALTLVRDAYIYYARSADPRVKRVELDATNPRGQFTLDIIIAGDSGILSSAEINAVYDAIRPRLLPAIAEQLEVRSATVFPTTLVGDVWYYSGFEEQAVRNAITAAVNGLAASLPIGGSDFPGYGIHRVLRSQWEKAILGAKVGTQPAVKLVTLTSPEEESILEIDSVVVPNTLTWSVGGLELHAVPE